MKPGINIISDAKGLGGALTNPTFISYRKGNITHQYPVTFNGTTYIDAEAAYKANIIVRGTCNHNQLVMFDILLHKLRQHPILAEAITKRGGVEWIESCSHVGYGGTWEGHGVKSAFIRVLAHSYYHTLTPEQKEAQPQPVR